MRRALASRGLGVIAASSGEDALRLFTQHREELSLILMDVTMPQMSGIEAPKRIRATGSDIPVVLSSGSELMAAVTSAVSFSETDGA